MLTLKSRTCTKAQQKIIPMPSLSRLSVLIVHLLVPVDGMILQRSWIDDRQHRYRRIVVQWHVLPWNTRSHLDSSRCSVHPSQYIQPVCNPKVRSTREKHPYGNHERILRSPMEAMDWSNEGIPDGRSLSLDRVGHWIVYSDAEHSRWDL